MRECKILFYKDEDYNNNRHLITNFGSPSMGRDDYRTTLSDYPKLENEINRFLAQGWTISGFNGTFNHLSIVLTREIISNSDDPTNMQNKFF